MVNDTSSNIIIRFLTKGQADLRAAKKELKELGTTGLKTEASQKKLEKAMAKVDKMSEKQAKNFRSAGVALTGMSVAIGAAVTNWVKLAGAQERVEKQLDAVLASTQGAVGLTSEQIKEMARGLQQVTAIGDESVISAQNILLTFTKIRGEAFEPATKAVLDMATAMNGGAVPTMEQLRATAIQVGKALNDPVLGATALSRSGIQFTQVQKDMIKNFVELGDVASAQAIIQKELETQFGGSAAAAAQTFEGRISSLKNQFGDFKEELGRAVIPVIEKLVGFLQGVVARFQAMDPRMKEIIAKATLLAGALAAIGGPALLIAGSISQITSVVKGLSTAMTFLATNPIGIVIAGLAALAIAIDAVTTSKREQIAIVDQLGSEFNDLAGEAETLAQKRAKLEEELVRVQSQASKETIALKQAELNTILDAEENVKNEIINKRRELIIETQDLLQRLENDLAVLEKREAKTLKSISKIEERIASGRANFLGQELNLQEMLLKKKSEQLDIQREIKNSQDGIANNQQKIVDAWFGAKNDSSVALDTSGLDFDGNFNIDLGGADGASSGIAKTRAQVSNLQEEFSEFQSKAGSNVEKFTQDYHKNAQTIQKSIGDMSMDLKALEESFKIEIEGIDQSIAERVLEQQKLIDDLRNQVASGEGNTGELQERLAKEEEALKKFEQGIGQQINLEEELEEAKRKAGMTEFERFIEAQDQRRSKLIEEFEEKKALLSEEIQVKSKALEQETVIFEAKQELIDETLGKFQNMEQGIIASEQNLVDQTAGFKDRMADLLKELQDIIGGINQIAPGAINGGAFNFGGARATGGPVNTGSSFLVGENGPEIFTPQRDGRIIPNQNNSTSVSINFGDVRVEQGMDINMFAEDLMAKMADKIRNRSLNSI